MSNSSSSSSSSDSSSSDSSDSESDTNEELGEALGAFALPATITGAVGAALPKGERKKQVRQKGGENYRQQEQMKGRGIHYEVFGHPVDKKRKSEIIRQDAFGVPMYATDSPDVPVMQALAQVAQDLTKAQKDVQKAAQEAEAAAERARVKALKDKSAKRKAADKARAIRRGMANMTPAEKKEAEEWVDEQISGNKRPYEGLYCPSCHGKTHPHNHSAHPM
jgi:hypothetical protein